MSDWYLSPYKKGTAVGPATLPRVLRPPSPGERAQGYDVLAYKRATCRAGRWGEWVPDQWDNVYWKVFALGKGTGNVADSGIRGIERQEGLAENGVLDDVLYQKMRRIRVPEGPHKGEPIFDGPAVKLLELALKEYGPGSEERKIREAITDFCIRAEINEGRWHYCVPTDHRILTEDGYKLIDEIGDSRVAVIDHETREIRFEPPIAINRFPYDGPMVRITSHGAEVLCTPDHSWPAESYGQTQRGRWYPGRRIMRTAYELNPHWAIPLTGFFDRGRSILSPRHAAILGWLVTDGTLWTRGGRLYGTIAQSEGKFLAEIAGLIGREPQPYRSITQVAKVYVPREDLEVIERVYQTKDDLPGIVARLDGASAEAMWQAMMRAEGDYSAGEGRFTQRPGPVMEAFQILTFLTGRCGFVRGPYANGMKNLYVRARDRLKWNGHLVPRWRGEIWCPTTSTGTWILEHDGLLLPTGNTQQRPYRGLGDAPEETHEGDCSSYVIMAYYWARQVTGLKVPDPSGYNYSGYGNTWDDLDGHPRVTSGNYLVGDLAHYDGHVTLCRKPGNADRSVWSSFGSEFGPDGLPLFYRGDFIKVVRPELL